MAISAAVAAVAAVGGAVVEANGAKNAAQTQANAANAASATEQNALTQEQQNAAPYTTAGANALQQLVTGTQPGGAYNTPFTMAQFQNSAGYNFQQQQGAQALSAQAAAGGMTGSPAAAEALANYNQQLASTDYNAAYSQYMQQENQGYNQQAAIANLGANETNSINNATQNTASEVGGNTIGAGNAKAAGQVAAANAYGQAITSVGTDIAGGYSGGFGSGLSSNGLSSGYLNSSGGLGNTSQGSVFGGGAGNVDLTGGLLNQVNSVGAGSGNLGSATNSSNPFSISQMQSIPSY